MPPSRQRTDEQIRFGAIIERVRNQRGWTIRKLAQRAGMNPTYLGLLERGFNSPSLGTMLELTDVLGIDPADVMREIVTGRTPVPPAQPQAEPPATPPTE
jgi:transcriptional regulator with XRE-family HTH domain